MPVDLCDFQYIPITPEIGSDESAVCKYSNLVPTGLPKASWLTGEAQYFLPPATFSRMDTMQVLTPYS
jgi:general transcription factor 3C polypeptide 5 (transcription factor C subunit 1)